MIITNKAMSFPTAKSIPSFAPIFTLVAFMMANVTEMKNLNFLNFKKRNANKFH